MISPFIGSYNDQSARHFNIKPGPEAKERVKRANKFYNGQKKGEYPSFQKQKHVVSCRDLSYNTPPDIFTPGIEKKDCKDFRFIAQSCKHGNAKAIPITCADGYKCSKCYTFKAGEQAKKYAVKLEGYRQAVKDYHKVKHMVYSPEVNKKVDQVDRATIKKDYKKYSRTVRRYLKKYSKGPYAGVTVYHAYRFSDKGKRTYRRYKENGGKLKAWDWFIKKTDNDTSYLRYSPHIHFIGLTYFNLTGGEFHKRTGWIYKTITQVKKPEEFKGIIKYALSHKLKMGKLKTSQAIGAIGRGKYNRLEYSKKTEPVLCEACGGVVKVIPEEYTDITDQGQIKSLDLNRFEEFPDATEKILTEELFFLQNGSVYGVLQRRVKGDITRTNVIERRRYPYKDFITFFEKQDNYY